MVGSWSERLSSDGLEVFSPSEPEGLREMNSCSLAKRARRSFLSAISADVGIRGFSC